MIKHSIDEILFSIHFKYILTMSDFDDSKKAKA